MRFSSVTFKTCDVTIQRANNKPHLGFRRKHWIETPISKLIINPFHFAYLILIYYDFYSIYHCVRLKAIVLYQILFTLFIQHTDSLFYNCVKKVDWKSTSILCFDDDHNKLVSTPCTATSNVSNVTDQNHKQCLFPILPVNVPWSYKGLNTYTTTFIIHFITVNSSLVLN